MWVKDYYFAPCPYVPLLLISEFVLNEKFQRNASKFVIFYIYINPKLPWSMLTQTRAFIRENSKVARNEKWKKQHWVFVHIKYGKFWSISLELFIEHKPWNWQEWSTFVCMYKKNLICSSELKKFLLKMFRAQAADYSYKSFPHLTSLLSFYTRHKRWRTKLFFVL